MEALPLRKETIFEGYVVPHYEALLLEREPPFYLDTKFLGYKHVKEWFEDYIKSLLERRKDKEPQIISLEDLIPVEVYRRVLQNPKTKFRFRIVVEAQEIKADISEAYG
jgi:hypothetical protein